MSAGIYLHVPFCKSRCSYCDFATDVFKNAETVERYVNALCKEITNYELRITNSKNRIETIYFGGGTPSLLSAKQLERILNRIHEKFSFAEEIEFTLEINPATVALEKLRDFKSLGVNRASFGVQTFDDYALKLLARGHDADDARRTFKLLREANFENISFDLIAGLPRQTLEDWKRNLDEALKLQPEHLSLYLLEIHRNTPLAAQIQSGRQPLPDDALAAEMYEILLERIAKSDYRQYEISNFCRAGFESKHNSKYWTLDPVLGFGCSAHSFDGANLRCANERDTAKYVALVESGDSPIVFREEIDAASEFVFLGLRLINGIELSEYEKRFGVDLLEKHAADLRHLTDMNLIEIDENRLKLTGKGALFSNEVFAVFV